MATIVCQFCERENEIPDDEVCPGYTDLIEALKLASELLKIGIGAEEQPVPLMILEALAKTESKY